MGADWGKLALIHAMIGYEANVLGLMAFQGAYGGPGNAKAQPPQANGNGQNSYYEEVQAMLILGFLVYTTGGILMVLTKLGGVGASIIFTILSVCAFILAALFLFIGVGLHADDFGSSAMDSYATTLTATSGCLGLLASTFLLLALCCKGKKGSSTSPS